MSKPTITNWKDCRDSKKLQKFLKQKGYEIREGKGSHWVASGDAGTFTGYHGEQSTGVAAKWFKWLSSAGLLGAILFVLKGVLQ